MGGGGWQQPLWDGVGEGTRHFFKELLSPSHFALLLEIQYTCPLEGARGLMFHGVNHLFYVYVLPTSPPYKFLEYKSVVSPCHLIV